ncbi:MAG: TIGR01841 family phasin [Betaproteobacteria bacterium]|nr:TIGR01841 family phasin [Betaproteobacteria bacterium]
MRLPIEGKRLHVTPEQIESVNTAAVDAILSVAAFQFSTIQRLVNLNAITVKAAFEGSIANARALVGAKDLQEFVKLQTTFAQPAIEKAIADSKSMYEVAVQSNADFSQIAQRRVAEWNEKLVSLLDKDGRDAPAGSDVAVTAVKQMIAAANAAYDSFMQAAKQATEIAEANDAAASDSLKQQAGQGKKVA